MYLDVLELVYFTFGEAGGGVRTPQSHQSRRGSRILNIFPRVSIHPLGKV